MTIHSVFDIPGFLPLMERLNGKPLQDLRKFYAQQRPHSLKESL